MHTIPSSDAAYLAFEVLTHPGSLWLDAQTVACLSTIQVRGKRDASPQEWALLRACHQAVQAAERRVA